MLLTEQEIRDIARSVKDIGENSDSSLILAAQKAVIAKIKAQGGVVRRITTQDSMTGEITMNEEILYRLPEGE